MHIEHEVKLNYDDVLIRSKRSTLGSRKEVDLERGFIHPIMNPTANNPDLFPKVIPGPKRETLSRCSIMASNMDGVGTFEMAKALASQKIMTCLVKNIFSK